MAKSKTLCFEIDRLTNSIENAYSGESFPTEVSLLTKADLKNITKKNGWLFDWKAEMKRAKREVYKLTTIGNPDIIQGLVCLQEKEDHVAMHLIENAPFNIGKTKIYSGVAGNLVAFVCKVAFERGQKGNVSFLAKTKLVQHYVETLSAFHFGGQVMIIDTRAARRLTDRYFPKFLS